MNSRKRLSLLLEKRANFSALVNAAKGNMGATIGAGLGGLYGAYQGASGPEASVSSTLLGAASGALGGGLIGGAAQGVARGLGAGGQPSVFSQIGQTRRAANEAAHNALGSGARTGAFATSRNIGAAKKLDPHYAQVTQGMAHADQLAQEGLQTAQAARSQIDQLAASNPYHAYEAAKKKLIYGTIGAGLAGVTGKGLLSGAGAGAADSSGELRSNLEQKYRETGKLDARQLALLSGQLTASST